MHLRFSGLIALLASAWLFSCAAAAQNVRFHTNIGDIDVAMIPASAPNTVANFMNYVNKGAFTNSIIHRSVPGFIVQGGGFTVQLGAASLPTAIPQDPAVVNEFKVSNSRGTLAMAKLGSDPNSATNQWFFNLADNSGNLNNQNGGFTVFGRVTSSAGLAVIDKIAAVPVYNLGSPYDQIPLQSYSGGTPSDTNYVVVYSVAQLPPPPAILQGGVATAGSFGGATTAAPGSFIEIYGTNFAGTSRLWDGTDFNGVNAPTTLDGVTVTVGGKPAYVNYVSPTQVNVQVPGTVVPGILAAVTVSYKGQSSTSGSIAIKSTAPGLLAPPGFKVSDKQYVVAVHAADGTFVSNGNVAGLPTSPAVPGETLTFYGTGFGALNPSGTPVAGQIASGLTSVAANVRFSIGASAGSLTYAGLAPGLVGVYQFNLTVPADVVTGDQPLTVTVDGDVLGQTLWIPVQGAK